jgi:hypothetical protein
MIIEKVEFFYLNDKQYDLLEKVEASEKNHFFLEGKKQKVFLFIRHRRLITNTPSGVEDKSAFWEQIKKRNLPLFKELLKNLEALEE